MNGCKSYERKSRAGEKGKSERSKARLRSIHFNPLDGILKKQNKITGERKWGKAS